MPNIVAYALVAGFLAWAAGGFILFNWGMNLATSLGLGENSLVAVPIIG